MRNMRNEKFIICLEVFKNLTLFLKSLWMLFQNIFKPSTCQLNYIKILRNSTHSEWFSEIVSNFKTLT